MTRSLMSNVMPNKNTLRLIRHALFYAALCLGIGLLSGCVEQKTTYHYDPQQGLVVEQRFSKWFDPNQPIVPASIDWDKVDPSQRIRVAGYGVLPEDKSLSTPQRNLLAQRASKLDAYRALAERVYGLKVDGQSQVSDLIVNNDDFRVFVDAYLRGAKVITSSPLADGSYETIMELVLPADFSRCASGGAGCPLPKVSLGRTGPSAVQCVEGDCQPSQANFYLQEEK